MVDLTGMMNRIRPELDSAINRVLNSERFIGGEEVEEFSKELKAALLNRDKGEEEAFIIPCANGTDALQIALMALGIGPGDEVIAPAFTFISTVEVIALLGAKPVLVDVHADTFNIDCGAVENAISEKTKAIVPVHLFGQCADMGGLMAISNKTGIPIVEDTAQSLLSSYCDDKGMSGRAGLFGAFGTTSFFPSKNLGCMGDGGALFTRDKNLAQIAKSIANHGGSIRYHHDMVGMNSRLDSLQAAILRVKLPHLSTYISQRQKAAAIYDDLLKIVEGVEIPVRDENSTHVFHQYTIQIAGDLRDDVAKGLAQDGIPTGIYYPKGIHEQKAFENLEYKAGEFPITEQLSKTVLSLPMHTELSSSQQNYIVERLVSRINDLKN
ncbi:MAG TPA: DegT/DnrJ/EryC1/StrS family aminotransferase [Flavobacteriales bacterium]|nr:DegT/DnrJ/EryC1/StrS family aminotransferase [Flavobacteriales bacterium]